jgi:hypothetical protein
MWYKQRYIFFNVVCLPLDVEMALGLIVAIHDLIRLADSPSGSRYLI